MEAAAIIALIEQYGPAAIALVESLITAAESKQSVTSAQWAQLNAALTQTAKVIATNKLTAAGIDPTSAAGVAFLELIK